MMTDNLLEPEYADAFNAWKSTPSIDTNRAFLTAIDPAINKAITTHIGPTNPLIYSRARQMALEAAKTYDPARSRLQTHLIGQLQGLKREHRRQGQIIAVPERVAIQKQQLQAAENALMDQLGRDPSDAELADHIGVSLKRLAHLRGYQAPTVEGAFGDNEIASKAVDNPFTKRDELWRDVVYTGLQPLDQRIMEMSLGMHGHKPMSNQMIAIKLGRTPGAISQRKAKIQEQLDQVDLLDTIL